jgi:tripeptidyl-peptidase-1
MASGDCGVAGQQGCLGPNGTIFNPTWPVKYVSHFTPTSLHSNIRSCPYVTSVGATMVYPGYTVYDPESAAVNPAVNFSSGGGFSNLYGTPDYQADAIYQ